MTFNLVKTAVQAAKDKHQGKTSGWNWIPMFRAVAGKFDVVPTVSLPVDKQGVLAVAHGLPSAASPRVLLFSWALSMAEEMDKICIGSDHLAIKSNTNWRRIY